MGLPGYGYSGLPGYDNHYLAPPDDDLWTCRCGEENNGGEVCDNCDAVRDTDCGNGRCGNCDRCDYKADQAYDEDR